MSTSSEVEAAWDAGVWANTTITAYTEQIHNYALTEKSETELKRMYFESKLNFIQAIVGRGANYGSGAAALGRVIQYDFIVEVSYYLTNDIDVSGDNWISVRDFFEDLLTVVRSGLGNTWSSTVDYWKPQAEPAEITEVTIADETAWRGTYKFYGTQQISL